PRGVEADLHHSPTRREGHRCRQSAAPGFEVRSAHLRVAMHVGRRRARNMTPAPVTIAPTIGKLLRLLGSDKDGEGVAPPRPLRRVLQGAGLGLHDRAGMVEGSDERAWRKMVRHCRSKGDRLSAKARDFVDSLMRWRGKPTERQLIWLTAISERLREK